MVFDHLVNVMVKMMMIMIVIFDDFMNDTQCCGQYDNGYAEQFGEHSWPHPRF